MVDTPSMGEFSATVRPPADHVLDFGPSPTVHHTNYFDQQETLRFISERLPTP